MGRQLIGDAQIAKAVGISKNRMGHILHEILAVRKLLARWVPHFIPNSFRKLHLEHTKVHRNSNASALKNYWTESRKNFLYLATKKVLFHHCNATAYSSAVTKLIELGYELLLHSILPISPMRLRFVSKLQKVTYRVDICVE